MQAELVGLRVGHDKAPSRRIVEFAQQAGAVGSALSAARPRGDSAFTAAGCRPWGDVDIGVDTVFHRFRLGHLLEQDGRLGPVGIDHRGEPVAILGRQSDPLGETSWPDSVVVGSLLRHGARLDAAAC